MRRALFVLSTWLLLSVLPSPAAWGIITSDAAGTHLVQPGSRPFGRNLDGVVKLYDRFSDAVCSGALIGDHYVLTAAHCVDQDIDGEPEPFAISAVQFDLQQGAVIVDSLQEPAILDGWRIEPGFGPDIAVLELAEAAPAGAPRYALYGGNKEVGRNALLAGYGASGHGAAGYDRNEAAYEKRAGLNRIDSYLYYEERSDTSLFMDFDSGLPDNDGLGILFGLDDLGLGDDEVMGSFGDSGGPVFVGNSIAGVMAAVYFGLPGDATDEFDSSWGELLEAPRVSIFQEFLITSTRGEATFVPEPETWALAFPAPLALFAAAQLRLRRSRAERPNTKR